MQRGLHFLAGIAQFMADLGGLFRFGTAKAVTRNAAMDEARILGATGVGIDAAALQGFPGRLIAQEDIGGGQEAMENFGAAGVIVIESDGTFVAIGGAEVDGLRGNEGRALGARLVAHLGAFDVDDIGGEIAKQHGGVRSGEGFRQFDNANSREDRGHGGRI